MPRFDLNGNPIPDDAGAPSPASPPNPAGLPPHTPSYPPPSSRPEYTPPPTGNQGYVPPPSGPYTPPPSGPYSPPPSSPFGPPPGAVPPPYSAVPPPYSAAQVGYPGPGAVVNPRAVAEDQKASAAKWIAGGIAVFAVFTSIILIAHPAPAQKPSGFKLFTAPNGTFSVDQPIGWKVDFVKHAPGASAADDLAGMTDPTDFSGVIFSSGTARVLIYQGTVKSISGDVRTPLPASTLLKKEESDFLTSHFASVQDLQDYAFSTEGFGDGDCITWSAPGQRLGFGGPMKGYYVAMSGGNYYVTVLCECRESDWNTLKPSFQDIVNSLTELPPPGYQAPVPGGEAYPSGPPPQRHAPINTTPGL